MNSTTQYIVGIYQINMVIRDTIGYAAPAKENIYPKDIFEHRRNSFNLLVGEGSPFAHFVSINSEKSEKLIQNIKDYQDEIFGKESRIFHLTTDTVEVDRSQHKAIYNMSIGIYQTLLDILNGYMNFAKESGAFEQSIADVVAADEYFFKSLAHYCIMNDVFKLFKEFSEAMRENKGEPSPVSKFINEDIVQLVGFTNFMGQHSNVKNVTYNTMVDHVRAFIDAMGGKRDLAEGQTFPMLFEEVNALCLKTLQDAEAKWRTFFLPLAKEYQQFTAEQTKKKPEDLA